MPASQICVDASLVVRLAVRARPEPDLIARWLDWMASGTTFVAPALFANEVANAVHRYRIAGVLRDDDASELLNMALSLGIELVHDPRLTRRALRLAGELGLSAAYDAHYLAVAEDRGVELWTGDSRLYRAVGERLAWVRCVSV